MDLLTALDLILGVKAAPGVPPTPAELAARRERLAAQQSPQRGGRQAAFDAEVQPHLAGLDLGTLAAYGIVPQGGGVHPMRWHNASTANGGHWADPEHPAFPEYQQAAANHKVIQDAWQSVRGQEMAGHGSEAAAKASWYNRTYPPVAGGSAGTQSRPQPAGETWLERTHREETERAAAARAANAAAAPPRRSIWDDEQ